MRTKSWFARSPRHNRDSSRRRRSLRTAGRPLVERMEDRTLMTVDFRAAFGAETIQWGGRYNNGLPGEPPTGTVVTSPLAPNNFVLYDPRVYFIFWGPNWTSTNVVPMVNAAKTVLGSSFLSGLTDYGSSGKAVYSGYTIDNSADPTANPGDSTKEIDRILPTKSWAKPGDPTNPYYSPIYVTLFDTQGATGNGGDLYQPSGSSTTLAMNHIWLAAGSTTDTATFSRFLSHEVAENVFDGDDALAVELPPSEPNYLGMAGPNAQIADNEPDAGRYTYTINGPGGKAVVQPYWSVSAQAFVVPDGNSESVTMSPIWSIDSSYNAHWSGKFDLWVYADAGRSNTVTLDSTATDTKVIFNGQTFDFPTSELNSVTIQSDQEPTTVNVQEVAAGLPVTLANSSQDTITVGKNGSVAGILGPVSVAFNNGPGSQTSLTVDDSHDPTARTLTQNYDPTSMFTTLSYSGLGSVSYVDGSIGSLSVKGGTGANTVHMNRTAAGLTTGLSVNGLYTVVVGDNGSTQGIQGNLVLSGPAGIRSLVLDDSADATGRTVTIDTVASGGTTFGRVHGLAPGTIEFDPAHVSGPVQVQTGTGGNTVNVLATLAALSLVGHGTDTVNVGNTGSTQGILGAVSVSNPPNYTALTIDDSADATGHIVTLTSSSVTGLAPAPISYTQADLLSLTVNGGTGGNIYNVQSTPNHGVAGTVVTSLRAARPDTVNIGNAGSAQGIVGTLSVSDPPSYVALNVDDSADAAGRNVTLTNAALSGLSPGPIQFRQSDISTLNIRTGRGTDTLNVQSTPSNNRGVTTTFLGRATTNVTVGNAGNAQGILGTLVFENSSAQDNLVVSDSSDPTARIVTIDTALANDTTFGRIVGLASGMIEFDPAHVGAPVQVQTGTGGDTVNVLATAAPLSLVGHGADRVTVGSAGSAQGILGALSVSNPANFTTLIVDNSADTAARTVTVTNASVTGLAPTPISYNQAGLSVLLLEGGSGQNTYNVLSTPNHGAAGTVVTDIRSFSTQDAVNVGNAGSLQGIVGTVELDGYDAGTALTVDDSAAVARQVATISNDAIKGLSPAPITYSQWGLSGLTIQGGFGPLYSLTDVFNVVSTPNNSYVAGAMRTTLVTHGRSNRVNVGNNGATNEVLGDLYVQAVGDPDVVTVDDSASIVGDPVTVGPHTDSGVLYTQVTTGHGRIDVSDSGTTSLSVSGGSNPYYGGTNIYTVNGTTPHTAVTLTTSAAGQSVVNVLGNSGTLTVNTRGAADVVNVGGPTTLDAIQAVVNVNRVAGAATLNVNDQAETDRVDYEIEPGVIQRGPLTNPPSPLNLTINYTGVSHVVVNGGSAFDLYGVGGSPAGTSLTVNSGTAFNEWIVADTADNLDDILGPLTLHSGSGEDLLEVYDYLNPALHHYVVSSGAVSRDGIQPVYYNGFGQVVVSTPSVGGSSVLVTSTSAQVGVTVVQAESNDTVGVYGSVRNAQNVLVHTMQTIAGQLSIQSTGSSPATITLDDSGHAPAAGSSRTVTFSQDPTYGDTVVNGLAPAAINLVLRAGTNVAVKGDSGDETFAVDAVPAGFNLSLDGQGGTNALDYSGYTGDVAVNLRTGTATGLSAVHNIRNVTGGNGNSLIVGDTNPNVLTGGTGRNVLIGGGGADTLTGGAGENILIGGTTDFDLNAAALQAIADEWDRTDVYLATRVADLTAGVASGGAVYALTAATVHADRAVDVLNGGGRNWFFVARADPDTVNGEQSGDVTTLI
jgi:hypothetical protein